MEESPAVSPDGKTVSFVAQVDGRRQIWIRLLAGGTPLQITHDDEDHAEPRWSPDSSSIIYYSPSPTPGEEGAIWEISALGGPPRRLASGLSGGDISHDGRRISVFQEQDGRMELAVMGRDGSRTEQSNKLADGCVYSHPRWSPDDQWIAFQRGSCGGGVDQAISVVPSSGGTSREIARGGFLRGISWLPDGSGIVYASAAGSTILYPPIFNLRAIARQGGSERQLTFGDVSYVEPDVASSGKLLASRIQSQSDIWKFPVNGPPAENTRKGIRITRQTGQAQTPSVSPDDSELVYLSDSGGHANLWVAKTDGSGVRQITFEQNPSVFIGVPVWSPMGNQIVFRTGTTSLSLINRDGSGLRELVPRGLYAYWSGDGRWLYYAAIHDGSYCIDKIPIEGGAPASLQCDNAVAPAVAADGSVLYYIKLLRGANGSWDSEIRSARPENGQSRVLTRLAGTRVPLDPLFLHPTLSPDGQWLAMPLTNGTTSNLWALPVDGGPMRQLTDFGDRPIMIARRISWSPDSKYLYVAVAETDADVVLLGGLLP